jgi:hypothetical protein
MEVGPTLEGSSIGRSVETTGAATASGGVLAAASPPVSFAQVLARVAREVDVGETQVRGALRATSSLSDLGPGELIALQAGVYRYSEVVDLTARLIDHATSGLKTVLQGQ